MQQCCQRLRSKLTCCIGITALHIFEGAAAVDDQVLCPSAEVGQVQSSEEERFHHKVPVTDGIHGVGADPPVEAQLLSDELAVHPKRVACQCSCINKETSSSNCQVWTGRSDRITRSSAEGSVFGAIGPETKP